MIALPWICMAAFKEQHKAWLDIDDVTLGSLVIISRWWCALNVIEQVLIPTAFRHSIARGLAFLWTNEYKYWLSPTRKNHAKSSIHGGYDRLFKNINWLYQSKRKDRHSKSHKKPCNCGVNYPTANTLFI